jgi:RNA polymerase sigma factor (sigma-70 family)
MMHKEQSARRGSQFIDPPRVGNNSLPKGFHHHAHFAPKDNGISSLDGEKPVFALSEPVAEPEAPKTEPEAPETRPVEAFDPLRNQCTLAAMGYLVSDPDDPLARKAHFTHLVNLCLRARRNPGWDPNTTQRSTTDHLGNPSYLMRNSLGSKRSGELRARDTDIDHAAMLISEWLAPYLDLPEAEIRAAAGRGEFRYIAKRFGDRQASYVRDMLREFHRYREEPEEIAEAVSEGTDEACTNSSFDTQGKSLAERATLNQPSALTPPLPEFLFRKQVVSAVEKLPADLREPLLLHYMRGLTYQQIGRELDITWQSAKARISRALKLLRVLLVRPK